MRGALAGEPVVVRNPDAVRPWQHVAQREQRLPRSWPRSSGTTRRSPARGTSAPTRTTCAGRAGSSTRLGELWGGEIEIDSPDGTQPHEAETSRWTRAARGRPRLATALATSTRAREHRRLVPARCGGRVDPRRDARADPRLQPLRRRRCERLPALRRAARARRRRPRHVAAVPTTSSARRTSARWSPSIRSARSSARVPARAARGVRAAREDLLATTRTSRRTRRAGSSTARRYADAIVERFGLGAESKVVEIASNDGYLLQYFVERGIPVLGIEPAANVAAVAVAKGIPTRRQVLRRATRGRPGAEHAADLLIGEQRARARPGPQRLRRGARDAARAARACSRSSSRTCCG